MEKSEYSVLKIYASSTDKIGMKLLYEYIVELAKEQGLAGATVYRGMMGFGQSSNKISSSRFWELTEKLPVMIELMDRTAVLEAFFQAIEPDLQQMQKGCLVSMEPVRIMLMKPGKR
ncbi:MAG: DUF190 domain-containing protein [Bacteroidales bacterium]|nr:DUF190 domain-containing protein [Bacteroidales bacterium]